MTEIENLEEVVLPQRAAEFARGNAAHYFPEDLIECLALDIGRTVDCYVPVTECEGAVADFVSAM